MYNIFEGVIEFVSGFWQVLPSPINLLYSAILATFVIIATFQIVWKLH